MFCKWQFTVGDNILFPKQKSPSLKALYSTLIYLVYSACTVSPQWLVLIISSLFYRGSRFPEAEISPQQKRQCSSPGLECKSQRKYPVPSSHTKETSFFMLITHESCHILTVRAMWGCGYDRYSQMEDTGRPECDFLRQSPQRVSSTGPKLQLGCLSERKRLRS